MELVLLQIDLERRDAGKPFQGFFNPIGSVQSREAQNFRHAVDADRDSRAPWLAPEPEKRETSQHDACGYSPRHGLLLLRLVTSGNLAHYSKTDDAIAVRRHVAEAVGGATGARLVEPGAPTHNEVVVRCLPP